MLYLIGGYHVDLCDLLHCRGVSVFLVAEFFNLVVVRPDLFLTRVYDHHYRFYLFQPRENNPQLHEVI